MGHLPTLRYTRPAALDCGRWIFATYAALRAAQTATSTMSSSEELDAWMRRLIWPERLQPQLDELRPLGRGRVPLMVLYTPAEATLLHATRPEDPAVTQAVRVPQGAFNHVRHGLEVLMNVHRPGRTRRQNGMMETA